MMEMVDDDGCHPIIGTSKCTTGIIFAIHPDPQLDQARRSFNEARQQFLQIQDELLSKGHETEELIGK